MRAGTCLHLILEELDFADLSHLRPLVARKLSDFHFENFDEVVCETLEKTLRVPLGEDGFTLSQVSRPSRLSELEFIFPITALTTERLRKVFLDGGAATCDRSPAVRAGQWIHERIHRSEFLSTRDVSILSIGNRIGWVRTLPVTRLRALRRKWRGIFTICSLVFMRSRCIATWNGVFRITSTRRISAAPSIFFCAESIRANGTTGYFQHARRASSWNN